MKVLSLFNGMSCGQIALERAGYEVEEYYSSEIKKHAIELTQHNYPNTIQLGDVRNVRAYDLPNIDLLIGGSPCQDFSIANKERKGLNGDKSSLFFEFLRIWNEVKKVNPNAKFLLENVVMDDVSYNTLSHIMGVFPVDINSNLVSAAHRQRSYWTNIGSFYTDLYGMKYSTIPPPKDKKIYLKDVIESGYVNQLKHTCLNTRSGGWRSPESLKLRNETTGMITLIYDNPQCEYNGNERTAFQTEMEMLQTVPIGYTSKLDKSKAGDLLGDGWTVDVIAHIFKFLDK